MMNQLPGSAPADSSHVRDGVSYADKLNGRKEDNSQGTKTVRVEGKGSLYPLHCIGRSIIGQVKDVWSLCNIKQVMEENGLNDFGLSYVGGLTSIITLSNKEVAMASMESHSESFSTLFSNFRLWNGEDIPFNRIATLNIFGVSFLIRENTLYDQIGVYLGKLTNRRPSCGKLKIIRWDRLRY
ncbi:hypothetical protein HanIR_Chr04g0175441 [Helianthus annuus]|nr:hypothetical protein HanIR_Chr04g0175441 [Helianthus annuus]